VKSNVSVVIIVVCPYLIHSLEYSQAPLESRRGRHSASLHEHRHKLNGKYELNGKKSMNTEHELNGKHEYRPVGINVHWNECEGYCNCMRFVR